MGGVTEVCRGPVSQGSVGDGEVGEDFILLESLKYLKELLLADLNIVQVHLGQLLVVRLQLGQDLVRISSVWFLGRINLQGSGLSYPVPAGLVVKLVLPECLISQSVVVLLLVNHGMESHDARQINHVLG